MKTTLQNIIKNVSYIAPGPAVSGDSGPSSLQKKQRPHNCEELAAIDIADGHICIAHVTLNHGNEITLQHAGSADYSKQESDAELAKKIQKLWKKCEIPTHMATTCLHTRSLSIKHFKYTGLTHDDLKTALQLEAEDAMQLPPEKIAHDWHLNPPQDTPDNPTTSGILISAPSLKIKRLIKTLRSAGIYPAIIDTGPTAISNLYLQFNGELPADESLAIINVADYHADICILYEGSNLYPRSICSQSGPWKQNSDYLVETLQDALLYYHVKVCKNPITRILVTGDIPEQTDLLEAIENSTQISTRFWNPLDDPKMTIAKTCHKQEHLTINQSLMATCLGLALRREDSHD
jgi:Tfp pilus assembly PilM family ATPase